HTVTTQRHASPPRRASDLADQSARRADQMSGAAGDPGLAHPLVLVAGGFQYTDGALCHDGAPDPEPVGEFAPAGRELADRLRVGDRKSTRLNSRHVKISYA